MVVVVMLLAMVNVYNLLEWKLLVFLWEMDTQKTKMETTFVLENKIEVEMCGLSSIDLKNHGRLIKSKPNLILDWK